jgi:thiamine-phosphate pyrophosphorylase
VSATPRLRDRLRLYLVTDRRQTRGRELVEVVEAALAGGVGAVQLREPDLAARELVELAARLRDATRRHDALLLINDRADVALACGADGVHLPGRSFAVADARALLGPERLVAVSTHRVDEVRAAARAGADFAVFGPVYDTPSKRRYGAPVGLAALARACAASTLPVLAIGGVDAERLAEVRARGAAGAAFVRAVTEAGDPEAAAADLRAAWERGEGLRPIRSRAGGVRATLNLPRRPRRRA